MEEGHSLDHGSKTDILTGMPVEENRGQAKEKQLAELTDRQTKHEAVVKDLRTDQGQLAIEKIHEALDARVQELVREDPTARALMSVLQRFGAEVVATRRIKEQVERLQRSIESL